MSVDAKFRTSATASGGREGKARSEDGRLGVQLATPEELGGAVETAHQICPYPNATRNGVNLGLSVS
jgi:organic hydroperoxide reductase OsmC/OhrA